MDKLVLCTYIKVLLEYRRADKPNQIILLNALFSSLFDEEISFNKRDASYIKNGKQGLPRYIMGKISEIDLMKQEKYYERFESMVLPLLRSDRHKEISKVLSYIIVHDTAIKRTDCVDYVSNITKANVGDNITPTFIAGVFLYILNATTNDNNETYADKINAAYCEEAVRNFDTLRSKTKPNSSKDNTVDSDIIAKANKFCIEFEDFRPLLPLCQIAKIVNSQHKHPNPMYTEYCCLPEPVQHQIMKSNEYPVLDTDNRYDLYSLIERFRKDCENIGLSSPDRIYKLYENITKTTLYESESIDDYITDIFPCIPSNMFPNHTTSTLSRFINDFLYIKDSDKSFPVPMNWMWTHLNLSLCPEKDIVFWQNWFIVNACYSLLPEDYKNINNPYLYMSSNIDNYVETIEDVHYLALLRLYEIYYKGE